MNSFEPDGATVVEGEDTPHLSTKMRTYTVCCVVYIKKIPDSVEKTTFLVYKA